MSGAKAQRPEDKKPKVERTTPAQRIENFRRNFERSLMKLELKISVKVNGRGKKKLRGGPKEVTSFG